MNKISAYFPGALAPLLLLGACTHTGGGTRGDDLTGYRPDYRRGLHIYNTFCSQCHDSGKNGAPALGDPADWEHRAPGFPALLQEHASRGFLGMPGKGGRPELSERNVADAVHYMLRELASEEEDD